MNELNIDKPLNYGTLLKENIMIPMRDGVRLACDIYFPALDGCLVPGRFPVILERAPYGKSVDNRSERSSAHMDQPKTRLEVAALFVRRGYVVIYQDYHGRYSSEGVFRKYLDDAQDGYDTCVWIIQQPWCSGQIGTKGLSYAAHTQAALASLDAPGIAAMFLDSSGFSNAYQGGIRQGGAFELKQVTWAYRQALNSNQVRRDPALKRALGESTCRIGSVKCPGIPDIPPFPWFQSSKTTCSTNGSGAFLMNSGSSPDTDFTAKLIDVHPPNQDYPGGYAMNLTDGITRVRYRDSWSQPVLMIPGKIYPIRIDLFPTSNLFKEGHRIRLDISSSNFPHFDLNFNTGEPEGGATHVRQARNRLFVDAERPSHLILPIYKL